MDKNELVRSIRVEYGDALFRIYDFQLRVPKEDSVVCHSHRYYELHLALQGSYLYRVGKESLLLSRSQMLIIPPDLPHDSADVHSSSYEFAALSFSLEQTKGESGYFDYFDRTLRRLSLTPLPFSSAIKEKIAELQNAFGSTGIRGGCYQKAIAGDLIYQLFDALDGFSTDAPISGNTVDEDRLILLDAMVYQTEKSLEDIARSIHYSPRHTARLIKAIYGCSLSELRRNQ